MGGGGGGSLRLSPHITSAANFANRCLLSAYLPCVFLVTQTVFAHLCIFQTLHILALFSFRHVCFLNAFGYTTTKPQLRPQGAPKSYDYRFSLFIGLNLSMSSSLVIVFFSQGAVMHSAVTVNKEVLISFL